MKTIEFVEIIFVVSGVVALASVILLISSLINGWVLSLLWAWFLVPTFHLPYLTLVQAIGLMLTVKVVTHRFNTDSDLDEGIETYVGKAIGSAISYVFIYPLLELLFAWVVHFFA